ncbi:hypothetical protein [Stieleria sp.]
MMNRGGAGGLMLPRPRFVAAAKRRSGSLSENGAQAFTPVPSRARDPSR